MGFSLDLEPLSHGLSYAFDYLSDSIRESETTTHELIDLNKTRKKLRALIFNDAIRKIDDNFNTRFSCVR